MRHKKPAKAIMMPSVQSMMKGRRRASETISEVGRRRRSCSVMMEESPVSLRRRLARRARIVGA